MEEHIQKEKSVLGVCKYVYVLTYIMKGKITPSHLIHILQGVLVGQVGQVVQFFHNLVNQVSQATLEVLWVQQRNPL